MKFLKFFSQLYESIVDKKSINDWIIEYNHTKDHNLDNNLKNRTNASELDFSIFLENVKKYIEKNNLNGDWTFCSFKYKIKIITSINLNKKRIFIVTILGVNEFIKKTNNIKII